MTLFENELLNKRFIIRLQWIAIALLAVLLLITLIGLARAPHTVALRLPPDLRNGASLKINETPPSYVYIFASNMWQQMHLWQHDGAKDYAQNIFKLAPFFTPGCRARLSEDMNQKSFAGELTQRTRAMSDLTTAGYDEAKVKPLVANRVWRVTLDTEISETVRGQSVKRVGVRYPLRVVQYDVDFDKNPFGLAVDCTDPEQPPTRIDLKIATGNTSTPTP
jgi:integrating conjugative element protein (TIGR03746 family)